MSDLQSNILARMSDLEDDEPEDEEPEPEEDDVR